VPVLTNDETNPASATVSAALPAGSLAAVGAGPGVATRQRILDAALSSVASKGYDGTSLDSLAATIGVTKQTILHHFGSKDGLLRALLERSVAELKEAVTDSLRRVPVHERSTEAVLKSIDRAVRSAFRLAAYRPELIALTREVARLGGGRTADLLRALDPLTSTASRFLARAVRDGAVRPHDAHALLLGTYARVIGAATEVEVMRQLGIEPPLRILVRRQSGLLEELHQALDPAWVS
jgi:TetR/AcrR family transcriptional regulator